MLLFKSDILLIISEKKANDNGMTLSKEIYAQINYFKLQEIFPWLTVKSTKTLKK